MRIEQHNVIDLCLREERVLCELGNVRNFSNARSTVRQDDVLTNVPHRAVCLGQYGLFAVLVNSRTDAYGNRKDDAGDEYLEK